MSSPAQPAVLRYPPARRKWRPALLVVGLGAALFALAALAGSRYLGVVDETEALRTEIETMVDRVEEAGLGIDRATIDALDANLIAARERFVRIEGFVATDPLVAIARVLPPTESSVRGADDVVAAAGHLLDAVGDGLVIGRRFVELQEARAGAADGSALAELVELLAMSRDEAMAAAESIAQARTLLAQVPDGVVGPVASARNVMAQRIESYGPFVDALADVGSRLPALLGWDGPRRYLILAQDPAEVRPSGGFIGSYGIVAFDRGAITGRSFQDVYPLDFPWDYPRIEPPQELADYLLGPEQPWQLADANWSPDFPTSASDARRLYANESGDDRIDGVIAITSYTIDEILKVTGPVAVPDYGATIASGETTLKVLQLTRKAPAPGEDRKAFLPAFADRLLSSMLDLPPERWGDLVGTADTLRSARLLLVWFTDPADQAFAVRSGFDGAVRQDPGDFLYPVDANVAPTTKLDVVVARRLDLDVRIDAVGNARNTLDTTWRNRIDAPEAARYRAMVNVGGRILGVYFRLLVPQRSRVESIAGDGLASVTNPAVVRDEAGRTAIGTYLMVPPGTTTLRCEWTSPYAATVDAEGGSYRLTIQAQPGLVERPLAVTIRVPDGHRITAASEGLVVTGATATLTTTFDHDVVVGVQWGP